MRNTVLFICNGCGLAIEPSSQVIALVRRVREDRAGTTVSRSDRRYAHPGHEAADGALGYRATARGVLSRHRDWDRE